MPANRPIPGLCEVHFEGHITPDNTILSTGQAVFPHRAFQILAPQTVYYAELLDPASVGGILAPRRGKTMTQTELAKAAGVAQSNVRFAEAGRPLESFINIRALYQALDGLELGLAVLTDDELYTNGIHVLEAFTASTRIGYARGVARIVQTIREAHGLTVPEFAGKAGTPPNNVYTLEKPDPEKRVRCASAPTLERYIKALGYTVCYLGIQVPADRKDNDVQQFSS